MAFAMAAPHRIPAGVRWEVRPLHTGAGYGLYYRGLLAATDGEARLRAMAAALNKRLEQAKKEQG